ncbi:MAG: ArnT family glycosyltransferase [Microbacter sp.]
MKTKTFLFFLLLLVIVNITGLFDTIFTGDSALYALISKNMVTSHNYWDMYLNGKDWLDKPHMPFWICAASMQLLGINGFAYKLPSVLLFLTALLYTYLLAKRFYSKETAMLSVLLLASAVHIVVSNNDVRAEAMLTAFVIGSVYHLVRLNDRFSVKHLLLAAILSAAAIMTKGIFVLIILYSAVWGDLLLRKKAANILSYRWLVVLALTMLFITPELYALYTQFDLHPEKVVFGKTHVSGIKFFLWDSQFGRFFDTGPIKGKGDLLFFVHTLLWAYAPWAILAYLALGDAVRKLFKKESLTEYVTFFGFSVMFVVFSVSRFQLPYYTNILMPFLSIMTASFLITYQQHKTIVTVVTTTQSIYMALYAVVIILLLIYFKPDHALLMAVLLPLALLPALYVAFTEHRRIFQFIDQSIIATLVFLLFMNLIFYPSLMEYQSGTKAAVLINNTLPSYPVCTYEKESLLQFYAHQPVISLHDSVPDPASIRSMLPMLCYADSTFAAKLKNRGFACSTIQSWKHFHITRLTKTFLNEKTRAQALSRRYLLLVSVKSSQLR